MNIKWIPAYVGVDEQNKPVHIVYTKNGYLPFPNAKTPVQVTQGLESMPKLDHQAHAEKARKVYEDAVKWTGS